MTAPTTGQLSHLVEVWHRACADFVALARQIPEADRHGPTDLAGWDVQDVVAHTAHLEAVLVGTPEETLEVPDSPHVRGPMGHYCEQGVLARRGRDLSQLLEEIEAAVTSRYAALSADPPTDPAAPAPRSHGGTGMALGTLLSNRPLDVWMHEQDLRRALDRPGGYDSPAAAHTMRTLGRGLPMVLGKRVAPPVGTTLRLSVPEAGLSWSLRVGDHGRAVRVEDLTAPDADVTLGAEDFVVLSGGRRGVEATRPVVEGDQELGRRLLASLSVTP